MFSYVLHILCDEHFKYDHVTYVELRNLPSTCGHNKDVPLGHSIHSIVKLKETCKPFRNKRAMVLFDCLACGLISFEA